MQFYFQHLFYLMILAYQHLLLIQQNGLMFATIFLILMSLGIALTRLKVFSISKAIISSCSSVILGPLIGIGFIHHFNLSGSAAGVLLIQCSMPSAVLNYLVGSVFILQKNY